MGRIIKYGNTIANTGNRNGDPPLLFGDIVVLKEKKRKESDSKIGMQPSSGVIQHMWKVLMAPRDASGLARMGKC